MSPGQSLNRGFLGFRVAKPHLFFGRFPVVRCAALCALLLASLWNRESILQAMARIIPSHERKSNRELVAKANNFCMHVSICKQCRNWICKASLDFRLEICLCLCVYVASFSILNQVKIAAAWLFTWLRHLYKIQERTSHVWVTFCRHGLDIKNVTFVCWSSMSQLSPEQRWAWHLPCLLVLDLTSEKIHKLFVFLRFLGLDF